MFQKILRMMASLKVTAVIIPLLILTQILATLVPQGQTPEFYLQRIPVWLQGPFFFLDYGNFFTSWIFLTLSLIFTLNLGVCTVLRLQRHRNQQKISWGADIIHIGLLLLMAGALWSALGRQEATITLAVGDSIPLPQEKTLEITGVSFETYQDGRPKEWTTTCLVHNAQGLVERKAEIRVNQPLADGELSFYQYSYEEKTAAELRFEDRSFIIPLEGVKKIGAVEVAFHGPVHRQENGQVQTGAGLVIDGVPQALGQGEKFWGITLVEVGEKGFSTLKAATDPGFPLVILAFLVAGVGMIIVVVGKFKEL